MHAGWLMSRGTASTGGAWPRRYRRARSGRPRSCRCRVCRVCTGREVLVTAIMRVQFPGARGTQSGITRDGSRWRHRSGSRSRACRVVVGMEPVFRIPPPHGRGVPPIRSKRRVARARCLLLGKPDKPDIGTADIAPRPPHAHQHSPWPTPPRGPPPCESACRVCRVVSR